MFPIAPILKKKITDFCRANGITRLDLFGSALRPDFGPESDIDLLVDFEPDRIPGLLDFVGMEIELTEILGREVDLVDRVAVEESRNPIRRTAMLESARTIYEAVSK